MRSILVIEDDPLFRPLLKASLEQMGYAVGEAEEGGKGLALYRRQPFDLVLTDLIMPDMEGIATIMELRKANPAVKIIAMSGGGRGKSEDYLQIARRVGADATLGKPFTLEELRLTIERLLAPTA